MLIEERRYFETERSKTHANTRTHIHTNTSEENSDFWVTTQAIDRTYNTYTIQYNTNCSS